MKKQKYSDGIYIDFYGKCWRLIGKVKDENEFNDFCKEHRLHKDNKGEETIQAGCLISAKKCKYRLTFMKKTGCLYVYGEHNHLPKRKHQGEKRERKFILSYGTMGVTLFRLKNFLDKAEGFVI